MTLEVTKAINTGLAAVGSTPTVLYTVPSTATDVYVITSLKVTNILATTITYTITITDASKSSEVRSIAKDIPLPAGATDELADERAQLEFDDILTVTCSDASGIDVDLSMLPQRFT